MSNPTPTVDEAVEALRAFAGDNLTKRRADRLLSFWHGYDGLTSQQIEEVAGQFPPDEPVERMHSYSATLLVEDVLAILQMHGVFTTVSAAEKVRLPVKRAKQLLRSLHIHPRPFAFPRRWWLANTYDRVQHRIVPPALI